MERKIRERKEGTPTLGYATDYVSYSARRQSSHILRSLPIVSNYFSVAQAPIRKWKREDLGLA